MANTTTNVVLCDLPRGVPGEAIPEDAAEASGGAPGTLGGTGGASCLM
jgi:hypothetical protein